MPTVAKNIKEAIAETEKNKNNLTKAKTKIDNKLVSLGGQSATDLSDVPNKIGQITNNLFKKAAFHNNWRKKYSSSGTFFGERIEFPVNFTPEFIAFDIEVWNNRDVSPRYSHRTIIDSYYSLMQPLEFATITNLNIQKESNKFVVTFDINSNAYDWELYVTRAYIYGK